MYEAKGDRGDCGFDGGLNPGASGCGAQQGASGAGDSGTNGSATEQSAASNASVTKRTVAVYDGEESKKQDFECLFRDDMPNVPYVDVEKYLELVFNDTDFVAAQDGDQFTYHGEIGDKKGSNLVVDTAKDTVSFEKPKSFLVGKQNDVDSDYIRIEPEEVEAEKELLYTLADYGIDLLAEGGKAYMPVSTISDINFQSYSWPDYVDGSIYLARYGSSSSSDFIAGKESKFFDTAERPADVAELVNIIKPIETEKSFLQADVIEHRDKTFGKAEKSWPGDDGEEHVWLYVFDNTAVFRFDHFDDQVVPHGKTFQEGTGLRVLGPAGHEHA